jgi:hypothetical protein
LFDHRLKVGAREIAAMPVPIDSSFRADKSETRASPSLER